MSRFGMLLLPLAALVLAGASEPASPEAVLARMRARQAKLVSLRAELEQMKSYPQLGIDDPIESGRFLLERGRRGTMARIEILKPEQRILTVKDGRYVLYQPRIRQAVEGRLAGSGAGAKGLFAGVLTASPEAMEELEQSYVLSGLGTESLDHRSAYHLKFTARDGAAVYCQEIDLFVDGSLDLPVRQSCREANRAVVTFTLSAVEIDVPLEEGLFELDLPPGVERVKGGS